MLLYPNQFTVFIKPGAYFERVYDVNFIRERPKLSQYIRLADIEVTEAGDFTVFLVLPDYIISNGTVFIGRYEYMQQFIAVTVKNIKPLTSRFFVHIYVEQDVYTTHINDDIIECNLYIHFVVSDSFEQPFEANTSLMYYGNVEICRQDNKYVYNLGSIIDELYAPIYKEKSQFNQFITLSSNPMFVLATTIEEDEVIVIGLTDGSLQFPETESEYVATMLQSKWNNNKKILSDKVSTITIADGILDQNNGTLYFDQAGVFVIVEHIFLGANITEEVALSILEDENNGHISASKLTTNKTMAI